MSEPDIQMKELDTHTDTSIEPLPILPGDSSAYFQESYNEHPNAYMDTNDLLAVRSIISANFGEYPISSDTWSDMSRWKETITSRIDAATLASIETAEYFEGKYGPDNDIAVATRIFSEITPELTTIASNQVEGYKGPRSWMQVDRLSSENLHTKIENILMNPTFNRFLSENATFKDGLLYIKDVLIPISDPKIIDKTHSEYVKKCIKENFDGKIVLNIPLESDYTHPATSDLDRTTISEASASLLIPLSKSDREVFDRVNMHSWEYLAGRKYARTHKPLNVLVGDSLLGAGFEVFSTTCGETFTFNNGQNIEHGFYFARNALAKKNRYWQVGGNLMNFTSDEISADLMPYFTLLYVPHENAHKLFPQHGIYGEVTADVPAVIYSLLNSDKKYGLSSKQMIRAMISEYVSEIIESMGGGELFDGYKADKTNNLFRGYLISGVVIMNAMAGSGILKVSNDRMIIDSNPQLIQRFIGELEKVDSLFHKKDPNIRSKIKLAVLTPFARDTVNLFRKAVGIK